MDAGGDASSAAGLDEVGGPDSCAPAEPLPAMGKRKLRRAVTPATAQDAADVPERGRAGLTGVSRLGGIGKESVMSRGKRKRTEKRARVEQKKDFIDTELRRLEAETELRRAALAAKAPSAAAGPALAEMSRLAAALACGGEGGGDGGRASVAKERPVQKVVHEKARRRILAEEAAQVKNVIEHPSFQADPMEALRQHLMNTVDEDPLAIPSALPVTAHQKRRPQRRELPHPAADRPTVSARTGVARRERGTGRRGEKAGLAAPAQGGRIRKDGRTVQFSQSLGRIGVPRPKQLGPK